MPKKPQLPEQDRNLMSRQSSRTISVGNISGVSGTVAIAGGDITTNQTITNGLSAADIKQLFDRLSAAVDARPNTAPADKEDLKAEVEEIHQAVKAAGQDQKPPDEAFLERHFRNIARMAPDILDVAVATLVNPLGGLGLVVKKIADKAKAEVASHA